MTLVPSVVCRSPAMQNFLSVVARLAPLDITVLLRGETGAGKEVITNLLHSQSPRVTRTLVRFNCAAIPEGLADSELFGHARGAFTGAARTHAGFFAAADGGVLVLDEVGELPLSLQGKLLRALQGGEVQQVGVGRVNRVDVRVVACTSRDLAADVRAGRFRADLYFRLSVVELVLPPLRERREDIADLASTFARHFGRRFGKPDIRLSPALIAVLTARDWPGNVRELENTVARMVAFADHDELTEEALMTGVEGEDGNLIRDSPESTVSTSAQYRSLRTEIDRVERAAIHRVLTEVRGNRASAARRLGISRPTLMERLRKYGLGDKADAPEEPSG